MVLIWFLYPLIRVSKSVLAFKCLILSVELWGIIVALSMSTVLMPESAIIKTINQDVISTPEADLQSALLEGTQAASLTGSMTIPASGSNNVSVDTLHGEASGVLSAQSTTPLPVDNITLTSQIMSGLQTGKPENTKPDPASTEANLPQKWAVTKPVVWGNREKPKAALTFDDGYDAPEIAEVLKVLKNLNVKCTFFIVGDALRTNADLFRQAVQDGHEICNHTVGHKYLSSSVSEDEICRQITGWDTIAAEVLGEEYVKKLKAEFPYLRLPGGIGATDTRVLEIVAEAGYIPVGWSDETVYSILRHYNLSKEPAESIALKVSEHMISNTTNGSIVLLHFNKFDVLKLEEMIKGIIDKGISLKTVSQLLAG